MKGKQFTSKLHWDTSEEPDKNSKYSSYNSYSSNNQQTYTPKGGRDFNFFKSGSSNLTNSTNMQRHSSEEEFKIRTTKMHKNMVSDFTSNSNNQESSSKNDFEEKIKLKNYINTTASTTNSSTFFHENMKDSAIQKSPKNARN